MKEAHRLKKLYAPQITLLVGLETEYITDIDLAKIEDLLREHPKEIELLVGSVHHVNSIPIDFDKDTFEGALSGFNSSKEFLHSYLDSQYEVMQRLKPEVIGHFDLCRLYTPSLRLDEHESVWGRVQRNIKFGIGYGALFEINAAAFRKGWGTAYPGREVLQVSMDTSRDCTIVDELAQYILANKGRITLSDDSHGPQAVGLNYTKMKKYLRANGVKDVWRLRSSSSPNVAGRYVEAVLVDNVFDNPFWVGRE